MPFVNVRTVRGLLDERQKREIQRRITDLMVEVEGRGNEAFRANVWVMIDEQEPENWSIGGRPVTPESVAKITG